MNAILLISGAVLVIRPSFIFDKFEFDNMENDYRLAITDKGWDVIHFVNNVRCLAMLFWLTTSIQSLRSVVMIAIRLLTKQRQIGGDRGRGRPDKTSYQIPPTCHQPVWQHMKFGCKAERFCLWMIFDQCVTEL